MIRLHLDLYILHLQLHKQPSSSPQVNFPSQTVLSLAVVCPIGRSAAAVVTGSAAEVVTGRGAAVESVNAAAAETNEEVAVESGAAAERGGGATETTTNSE